MLIIRQCFDKVLFIELGDIVIDTEKEGLSNCIEVMTLSPDPKVILNIIGCVYIITVK